MKRCLVFLLVFTSLCSILGAQSVTLNALGIYSPSGTSIIPGNTVEVNYSFTTTDYDEEFGIIEGSAIGSTGLNNGYVRIQWYTSTDASGTSIGYTDVAVGALGYTPVTNGTTMYDTNSFALPTPPVNDPIVKSFIVRSRVYGDDGMGDVWYSSLVTSSGSISGYSAYLSLNTNSAPIATGVSITNTDYARVGQTLTGAYTYNDADSDSEGTSTFRWLRASTVNGTYTAISGATSNSYTVTSADADHYLKFEVTPLAATGTSPGTPVLSTATPMVTEPAFIEVDPYPFTVQESASNNGSVGSAQVKVLLSNGQFVNGTISGISLTGLPAGLSIGTITRVSGTEIRINLTGAATYHEYAASLIDPDDIYVTVPEAMMVGVDSDLNTSNGFYVQFANNGPTNPALDSVGHNEVTLTWDNPEGLLNSGSGLDHFKVWRNDLYLDTVYFSKGTYFYTDTDVTTGIPNTYKIQACYNLGGDNVYSSVISATPLAITTFSFASPAATGNIDHDNQTISVTVPNGTNLSSLVASFTAPGSSVTVKVGSTTQVSGTTANNFSSPVVYTISAADGSTCNYTVTVSSSLPVPVPLETGFNETTSSFCAKWQAVSGATGYELDVSLYSDFSSFLSGYEALQTGNVTSYVINDLSAATTHYFRLRATGSSPSQTSGDSNTATAITDATSAGSGDTEIDDSDPTVINVGNYATASQGTVTPTVTVNPDNFIPGADNFVSISMSYGTNPEGLQFNLSFENHSIGNGSFVLSYSGLAYDPTDVRYRLNAGALNLPASLSINTTAKTITIGISGLSKDSKASYELQIVTNDETGETLPIVLSSFTAIPISQGQVRIDWITQSETGIQGFHILRNTNQDISTATIVSPLIPGTNTSTTMAYSFTDAEIPGNGTYYYWLQSTDMDGMVAYFGPNTVLVNVDDNPEHVTPLITLLKNPYPNPFNPTLTIAFDLAKDEHVQISVYNLKGQLVRELVNGQKLAAAYRIPWDGKDSQGKVVSSGSYIVKMNAGKYKKIQKVVMLK